MSLQITRAGIEVPSDDVLASWRDRFAAHHSVRLPQFFEPQLYVWIRGRVAAAPFVPQRHPHAGSSAKNQQLNDAALHLRLWTLLNDVRLFRVVEQLAACGPIGCCVTHVYSLDATPASRDVWHGDADGNRLVALSVNVGGRYDGGSLQIRDAGSGVARNPSSLIAHPESSIANPQSLIINPESLIRNPSFQNPESRIQNPESTIRNPPSTSQKLHRRMQAD